MDWFDIDHNGIVDGRDFFMRGKENLTSSTQNPYPASDETPSTYWNRSGSSATLGSRLYSRMKTSTPYPTQASCS